jgi:hypothetical protein
LLEIHEKNRKEEKSCTRFSRFAFFGLWACPAA